MNIDDKKLNKTFIDLKSKNNSHSFEELYNNLPLDKCGYNESNINKANPNDMEKYYPKEKQSQYGVVGIEISLIEN